jgi:5,10-methylenetetrahydromethanopterin reductase
MNRFRSLVDESTLAPQVEDMSIFVIAGRTWDPGQAIIEGDDAERLGFRRVWLSERYDLKEAGAILGGIAARTTRLGVATGIVATGSRPPLMSAALAATLQATYGHRFVLGLGRSSGPYLQGQGIGEASYAAFADYFDIVRRLLRGETVSYDGPAGHYEALRTVDPCPGEPPELWATTMGGPIANRVAAQAADGTLLVPFLTVEAVHRAVTQMRSERERLGLDPAAFRICHPIVCAPNLSEERTLAISASRLLTYIIGMPVFQRAWININGWDRDAMQRILDHPQFQTMSRATADQTFHREQMMDPAQLVPEAWMQDTCAIGTVDECVNKLREFREAGVDELALYGSTPAENAAVIAAWREAQVEAGVS